ncbi:MAG: amidase [Pseudomonadota bacterium]
MQPDHEPLLTASVTELVLRLRRGELSSHDLVHAHIAHAERVNQTLNAIVHDLYKPALAHADLADARIQAARRSGTLDRLPPLLGVPCTIKENFEMTGTPQASGLWSRRDIVNDSNAPTVKALLDAGAIPLGVTNTSELCMWMESYNDVYGRCNNPYDPRRTVGGSSGGEGSIVGSGASPFGLGADVGGSIRMPSFFNGVFGHKGSPQLIPNAGQYPEAHGKTDDYLSTGPICRRAEDLPLLVRVLAGDRAGRLGDVAGVTFERLRVLTLSPERMGKLSVDQRMARDRAVRALRDAGARHKTVDFPLFDKAFDIWSSMLALGDTQAFAEMMYGTRNPARALLELGKLAVGQSRHTLPLVMLSIVEKVPEYFPGRAQKFQKLGEQLRAQLDDALGDDGVMVELPYPVVAPLHGHAITRHPFSWVRCAVFNTMELPSTCVPMGLDGNGLPTGVQIVAGRGRDHVSIACAQQLERAGYTWVPPWKGGKRAVH